MPEHRTGENSLIPIRKERFFCDHGAWYFEARGGIHHGPYSSKAEMEAALATFIQQQRRQPRAAIRES